ncbi:MAG: CPA2 family monovalent cation:H+ antiporter-2 [Phenylobacterium sp.]|jgi:CPA2 family monovalent cation:H+ antiporter-2
MTAYFIQAFIYLCAAVIAVPIAKKLGLGSVLGYLIAGVIIGPSLGLVGQETATIQHYAEFGVVMMLFLVGLELDPKTLWEMRHRLLGLGGLQVGLTTAGVMILVMLFGQQWSIALAIGLIFSLSSTAIVLQTFSEKGLSSTEGARNAFSVLLFQDIAVIFMLALIPLLSLPALVEQAQAVVHEGAEHYEELSLVANLSGWVYGVVVVLSIVGVIVAGHFLSRPLFRYVADSGLREIFTTAALMLVIGIAALMSLIGLSPALGTFLAGVVLANSEFRHELESNIEPFKGLLLGLFFITVGAGINFGVLSENVELVIGLTIGVIALKGAVLYALALIFKINYADRWLFTLSLAQAGEFGFVLLTYSAQSHVLPMEHTQILSLVVAISMFLTPGLFIVYDKIILPRFETKENKPKADDIDEQGTVIIAGIGRFGQIINRLLVANGVKTVVLDHEADQVENMRKIKVKSFFGDATRPALLHTAGIENAKLLVIAIDDPERTLGLVKYMKTTYPHVRVLTRAYDRRDMYRLKSQGADYIVPETYHSALELGRKALTDLGFHPRRAEKLKNTFMDIERTYKSKLYAAWLNTSEENRLTDYRKLFIQLEEVLGDAMKQDCNSKEPGWTLPTEFVDDSKDV